MRKLMATAFLAGLLGLLPSPKPADATVFNPCISDAIATCNNDFGGSTERLVGIRGWCYLIRWGWCSAFDDPDAG